MPASEGWLRRLQLLQSAGMSRRASNSGSRIADNRLADENSIKGRWDARGDQASAGVRPLTCVGIGASGTAKPVALCYAVRA